MENPSISIYCPHCHQHTSLTLAPVHISTAFGQYTTGAAWECGYNDCWWIGICNYCNTPVLVRNKGDIIYPTPLPTPTDERIPQHIRIDLEEAKRCYSATAWRATCVMARRALQSCATDKGATKSKLQEQISELADNGVITRDLKEWADVVRWVGNDAAHPGGDNISHEDAEAILKLAEQFLYVVYVAPAIAKSLRAQKKK